MFETINEIIEKHKSKLYDTPYIVLSIALRELYEKLVFKSCKLYKSELEQLNIILKNIDEDYDGLIDIGKSVHDFKKAIEK